MRASFYAGVEYKGVIYYSESWLNAFCAYDLSSQEVKVIKCFDKEDNVPGLFLNAVLYEGRAWFIPGRASHVVCVDLSDFSMDYFDIPYHIKAWKNDEYHETYFEAELVNEKYLYCFPKDIDALLMIDLETMSFTPIYGINNCLGNENKLTAAKSWNDTILLFYCNSIIYRFLDINDTVIHDSNYLFSKPSELYCPIIVDDKLYMLDSTDREIVVFSPGKQEERYVAGGISGSYYKGIVLGNDVLFFPTNINNFLCFNTSACRIEIKKFENSLGEDIYLKEENLMQALMSGSGKRLITTGNSDYLIDFDNPDKPILLKAEFDKNKFIKEYVKTNKRIVRMDNTGIVKETVLSSDDLRNNNPESNLEFWLARI